MTDNYYEQLYDVNFFSCDTYLAGVDNSEISIVKPGVPMWDTWKSDNLEQAEAENIWLNLEHCRGDFSDSILFKENIAKSDFLLLVLLLCEDAYRSFNERVFFQSNRMLYVMGNSTVKLKALKLQYAWRALACLSKSDDPLRSILEHGLAYLKKESSSPGRFELDDIKVEIPVRNDWEKKNVSNTDENAVIDFYRTTNSYILELLAANHQVETLFNYYIIVNLLKRLGVSNLFDYGAGIGTFLLMSKALGVNGVYSDIESNTMRYAKDRLRYLSKQDISFVTLDPYKFELPEGLDCVICTEVLEHVFEPEELIKKIQNSLRTNGILVVSESFDYVDGFCSHLPQHKGKGAKVFLNFLLEMGFRELDLGFTIHPSIHVKLK